MTRWTLAGLLVALFGLLLTEIQADMIGPRRPGFPPVRPLNPPGGAQPNSVRVKLVVKVDENAKQAILQVPSNLARGQLIDGNLGQAPEAPPQGGQRFGLATMIAGFSLTLALASGGLWLARRGSRRMLTVLILGSVVAAGTAGVWADLAPRPGNPRPRPPAKHAPTTLKLPAGLELSDSVILQPMPPANYLTLIVPKAMVLDKEKDEKPAPRDKQAR